MTLPMSCGPAAAVAATAASIAAAHPLFGDDAPEWLGAAFSVARREVDGGTGPEAVRRQLDKVRAILSQ